MEWIYFQTERHAEMSRHYKGVTSTVILVNYANRILTRNSKVTYLSSKHLVHGKYVTRHSEANKLIKD